MGGRARQVASHLVGFRQLNRFEKGLGALLPEAYKKFWREWKQTRPPAVHYIPEEEMWIRDEVTGEIKAVQDVPLPLIDVPESNDGIWGGEAVIKGFQKRNPTKRRVPHFWVPVLRRSVVRSDILNEYMSVVLTDRTIEKIHECLGFDHYLLKSPACELRSALALRLKREILLELFRGCPAHASNPLDQKQILKEYKCYVDNYTSEEIEWYGYTYKEALAKLQAQMRAKSQTTPYKIEFRERLIEQIKQSDMENANDATKSDAEIETLTKLDTSSSSWLAKINPFKKRET